MGASVWHEEPDFGFSGWADIAAVEPVHIEAGAGCAVVATVVHQNGDILRLAFSDGTEVTGTGRHRFWSETRRDWVAARELREGEALRTPSGVVRLESATPQATLRAVYNLEVEGAHEYFVGEGEVLVHNGGGIFGCGGHATFKNRHPDDPPLPIRRRVRLVEENGRWYEYSGSTRRRTQGRYDFVVQDDQVYGIRRTRVSETIGGRTQPGHVAVSEGRPVQFAGQVHFAGGNNHRGVVRSWSNGSGHFRPHPAARHVAPFPEERFVPDPDSAISPQLPVFRD